MATQAVSRAIQRNVNAITDTNPSNNETGESPPRRLTATETREITIHGPPPCETTERPIGSEARRQSRQLRLSIISSHALPPRMAHQEASSGPRRPRHRAPRKTIYSPELLCRPNARLHRSPTACSKRIAKKRRQAGGRSFAKRGPA